MRKFVRIISPVLLLLLAFSCSKTEEVLVPDNTAPPDYTIPDVVIESYANRAYISLLGRKPDETEAAMSHSTLRTNNLSEADRETFLDGVTNKIEYNQNFYAQAATLLLNNTDTTSIQEDIYIYNLLLQDPQYEPFYDILNLFIVQLTDVLNIPAELESGAIDPKEAHRRLVYNPIYDDINMGTQNFVISLFQNFLDRYPTAAELEGSELMVNGFNSQVFLETGKSKTEFIDIFFRSLDYHEGQVRTLYNRYLFRAPDSQEMSSLANLYKTDNDYKAIQKAILASDEFIGI